MAEKFNTGKNRKRPIIAIIVIVAVVAVGLFGYFRLQSMAGQTSFDVPETTMLTKTDLESKVTAMGNFTSGDPVTVGSNVQGAEVEEVFAEEGSLVYAGDMLAKLKTSEIERNIKDTKSSISEAQKSDQQQRDAAQRSFNDADSQYYADEAQTNKAVEDAYYAVVDAMQTAEYAKNEYNYAQEALNRGDKRVTKEEVASLSAKFSEAERALNSASSALSAAEQARDNTMRSSNSRWYDAKAQLDSLADLDSARQMRSQLDTLNENLANASITSPITGIVTQVNTEAGMAAMGTMFIVENTELLQITATVAEYDVIRIEKGMKAHITSNATGDETYEGEVSFVAPTASDTGGNFAVKVLVTSSIGQLKPGMTATVEIVTESKNGVFAVPIDAVVTKPDGTKVVYAYEPGSGPVMVAGDGPGAGGDSPGGSGPVMVAGDGPGVGGPGNSSPRPDTEGRSALSSEEGGLAESEGPESGGPGSDSLGGSGPGAGSADGESPGGDSPGGSSPGADSAESGGPGGDSPGGGAISVVGGAPIAGNGGAGIAGRREIVVTIGMETDYYVEIISDELAEGMLIISDPLGLNVRAQNTLPFGMMGGPAGGQAMYVETTVAN